jgi:hypothetical protein
MKAGDLYVSLELLYDWDLYNVLPRGTSTLIIAVDEKFLDTPQIYYLWEGQIANMDKKSFDCFFKLRNKAK